MSPSPMGPWFAARGWEPFDYQREAWAAYRAGRSGLIHAPTGMGKTYAALGGVIDEWVAEGPTPSNGSAKPQAARLLWVTPLRALAADIAAALREPIDAMDLPWSVELRTGDTAGSLKQRQNRRLPTVLVTTPESLSLLLSHGQAHANFGTLRCVVVDEWHELMGTKRGVQMELALARLRSFVPGLRTWGLSATLGNLDEALGVLMGCTPPSAAPPRSARPGEGPLIIHGPGVKRIEVVTLMPERIERFPWYGHLGVKLREAVAAQIERADTTLLFTNTRSQAELWFAGLIEARPDWIGQVALHHGSLDRKLRSEVEAMLASGRLRAVVCTSSLDLGVDFSPVDQVMQVGSPKGIARLMQRAGRSGHQPGRTSRAVCVPTHAFELVEFAAARRAMAARDIEARPPLRLAMDVLAQHLVTVAAGEGFVEQELLDEVRTTHAFAQLTDEQWQWAMAFVTRGGRTLGAYPQYHKVKLDEATGRYHVADRRLAQRHRMMIGTITGDAAMLVKFSNGRTLGTIEESFIGRMKPGDRFLFAGRRLELLRVHQMAAYVKTVARRSGSVPRWAGARFPLSTRLADHVRDLLEAARHGRYDTPEMRRIRPLLELQAAVSRIPGRGRLLIERTRSREGHHLFFYPFAGRLVHEGLAALVAYRITAGEPRTVTVTANDYGIELLSPNDLAFDEPGWRRLFDRRRLLDDLLACVNATQLARRCFRDIARIAGLVFAGYPGERRAARHLQASSELFFDVFRDFDPDNLLLDQARREVLDQQLEHARLTAAMRAMRTLPIDLVRTERLSPLAFPLYADRMRTQYVSTEQWSDRVARMAARLEAAAT